MISIIIPIYNVEQYLSKCLESVINQTYKNIEIILINDGSTDNSGRICDEYSKKDKRIKVLHKKNGGVSSARNEGLKIANGKYIGFVDPDDYISSNMFEILINNMEKYNVDLSIINYDSFQEYSNKKQFKNTNIPNKKILNKKDLFNYLMGYYNSFGGYTWNKLYKMEIIKTAKLNFDEKITICEDVLFNTQYINNIKNGIFENIMLYHYLIRNNGACNSRYNSEYLSVLESYEKINNIYDKNNLLNHSQLHLNNLDASINIKLKMINSKIKDKVILRKINNNINHYIKLGIIKNNNLTLLFKIKKLIECYCPRLYLKTKK